MNSFVQALDLLPKEGLRLKNGLALRLSAGNGMVVLGCSRIDAVPSDEEMTRIQDAVWQVFKPAILLQADTTEFRFSDGYEHRIRRLYWPIEKTSIVRTRPQQQSLLT